MHNLMRTTLCMLATSLLLLPGASAQGPSVDLDLDTRVSVDAQPYVDGARGAIQDAAARAEATAGRIQGEVSARAEAALEETQAEASAQASAGGNAAQRAIAGLQAALEALGDFAAGFFANVDLSARFG